MSLATNGEDRIPDSQQRPLPLAVLRAALEQLDELDGVAQELLDGLKLSNAGASKSFLLDYLGELLGLRRLLNQADGDYRLALLGRVVVRRSRSTAQDIKAVARFIADAYGNGSSVVKRVGPKTLAVGVGGLTTDPAQLRTVVSMLLDSIGEVDRLTLFAIPANAFTWDTVGAGWDQGVWSPIAFTTD